METEQLPELLDDQFVKVHAGKRLTYGKFSVHVSGELVPIVEVDIPPDDHIYFEHHTLLAKDSTVKIALKARKGLGKRLLAGLPLLQLEASGPGVMSLCQDGVGEIIVLKIADHEIDTQQHHFLFATSGVSYDFSRVKGFKNFFGGAASTFFIDRFSGNGLLALHGFGNVIVRTLDAGESIDLEPKAWLFKDSSVMMDTFATRIGTGLLGGSFLWMTRFAGPGRVAYESLNSPVFVKKAE